MSALPNQPTTHNGSPSGAGPVKHRACDDCRTRKLACTKEPDGCARCKKEGLTCHYSAQKQMGRPRKKPKAENAGVKPPPSASDTILAQQPSYVTTAEQPATEVPDMLMDMDPSPFIDPGLGTHPDASFLELLGPDFVSTQPFHAQQWQPKANPLERDIWSFDISFDNHYPPPPPPENSDTSVHMPPSLSTPSLSSQGASTPENAHRSTSAPPGSCGCLANLYLALDALTHLPTEVEPAIRAARSATKAAHESTHCRVCCPPLTESMTITMSSFQNMMILGALFPSVVDAYRRIIDMIEIETARAICERRQMHFSLPDYGGMWGQLGSEDNLCGAAKQYEDVTMEPAMWRLTIRALLKVDVYGVNCGPEGPGSKSLRFSQMGLKDIVTQLEERSVARHAEVDALLEAGLPGPVGPAGVRAKHSLGEEPQCKRIIKLAKDAIASLDIP
ncbi:hypothetical protein N8I77_004140 [Diaporthe amygdali]|uniref:Zn(2)-C6 fungal-type domain-containing protein n=1 Tax=Phomopsis amygdali TaxID=1214568 RepID=A0AAD9W5L0_PHOAM|nr:hypothetical protein N8I77_004140 [Diaporthe amygdali]